MSEREALIREAQSLGAEDLHEVNRLLVVMTSGNAKAQAHIYKFIDNPPEGALRADYIKALDEAEAIMEA